MAGRAIWKGTISCGALELPVKLYSAVEDRSIHFRLLSKRHRTPIKQRMVDPGSGEEVPSNSVRKGYEIEPGVFVVFEPEELESLQPEASRSIEVLSFVPRHAIPQQWYERPYYLGPDGSDAKYSAFVAAIEREERAGIVRWVMRNTEYAGALIAHRSHLSLVTLRHAEEVVSPSSLQAPEGKPLEARELTMAEQLVGALTGDFDPEAVRDEHRARVRGLIEAKAHGKKVKILRPERAAPQPSLAKALEASLSRAKKAPHARKKVA